MAPAFEGEDALLTPNNGVGGEPLATASPLQAAPSSGAGELSPFRFRRVVIVGVGLIGGSIGLGLRERGLAGRVVGVGRSVETLDKAVRLGAIDEGVTDLAQGVAGADLVILATPIAQILADLQRLPPLLSPGALVTDVGSTKANIAQTGRLHLGARFVAGHPMAGSEQAGVEAARANLFDGATWAITPFRDADASANAEQATRHNAACQTVTALAQALGARAVTLDAHEHDRAVALTSHLPHVLAYALAALGGEAFQSDLPHVYDLAAGSWASATRVAASPPELWRDVALTNRDALLAVLRRYQAELDAVEAALENADANALLTLFGRGRDAKRAAPQ